MDTTKKVRIPAGDLILYTNLVLGLVSLSGALILGFAISPALFIVNVAFAMLSIAFMAYNKMGPDLSESPEGDPHGLRYRALRSLSPSDEKKLNRILWLIGASLTYGVVAFALKTSASDQYAEGTSLAFLITLIWFAYFVGDYRHHLNANIADREPLVPDTRVPTDPAIYAHPKNPYLVGSKEGHKTTD